MNGRNTTQGGRGHGKTIVCLLTACVDTRSRLLCFLSCPKEDIAAQAKELASVRQRLAAAEWEIALAQADMQREACTQHANITGHPAELQVINTEQQVQHNLMRAANGTM